MLIKSGNTNLNRVLVLALDGFPHSLLMKRLRIRPASTWHQLLDEGSIYSIRSSRPEVSSVAWACYLTGVNPGEHGLFGFVDRTLNPLKLYFPNGASIRVPTILEKVDEAGGTVVSINFPATFPPKPLRGLIVGGFLGVRLETNVQPLSWLEKLNRHRYVIDADTSEAYHDREKFYNQLTTILESRFTAALEACREFDWTLFQLHLMETDRLFHFFWGDKEYEERFNALLDRVDEIVETFSGIARKKDASFVVLSDHGFTRAKRIFFINAFLRENGYLEFDRNSTPGLSSIDPRSRAYALPPARIFLNLTGREPNGRIKPGAEYDQERTRLSALLRDVKDPVDGLPVFDEVVTRENLYSGPFIDNAADLIAFPRRGIDIKADFNAISLFETPSTLIGTHTYDDALFYVRGDSPDWNEKEGDIILAGRHVKKLAGI